MSNLPAVRTRKELADTVGIGEVTMGKVMQIDEHAPAAIRDALDRKELSVNGTYKMLKTVQQFPTEEQEAATAELIAAVQEVQQIDAAAEQRGRIARLFCKAFEWAVQLRPTRENVQLWVEGTRMRADEIEDSVKEAEELSEMFAIIAEILRTMQPIVIG